MQNYIIQLIHQAFISEKIQLNQRAIEKVKYCHNRNISRYLYIVGEDVRGDVKQVYGILYSLKKLNK